MAVPRNNEELALQVYEMLEVHDGSEMPEVWRDDRDGVSGEVLPG
jgi:hypothetical protein